MTTTAGSLPNPFIDDGHRLQLAVAGVDRYRDRHAVSGAKSDPADALVLARLLRTDRPMHRPLPADAEQAQVVRVLARAHQDAIWARRQERCRARREGSSRRQPGGRGLPES